MWISEVGDEVVFFEGAGGGEGEEEGGRVRVRRRGRKGERWAYAF